MSHRRASGQCQLADTAEQSLSYGRGWGLGRRTIRIYFISWELGALLMLGFFVQLFSFCPIIRLIEMSSTLGNTCFVTPVRDHSSTHKSTSWGVCIPLTEAKNTALSPFYKRSPNWHDIYKQMNTLRFPKHSRSSQKGNTIYKSWDTIYKSCMFVPCSIRQL